MDMICHSMLAQIHITHVFVNEKQVKTIGKSGFLTGLEQ